jgi:hypothetical protein
MSLSAAPGQGSRRQIGAALLAPYPWIVPTVREKPSEDTTGGEEPADVVPPAVEILRRHLAALPPSVELDELRARAEQLLREG